MFRTKFIITLLATALFVGISWGANQALADADESTSTHKADKAAPASDLNSEDSSEENDNDPWESYNRGVFSFNETFDEYFLSPVADGFTYITPKFVRTGLGNFFSNLEYPVKLISDIIQLDAEQAWTHSSRFVVNSTVGVCGFMDVATDMGIEDVDDDLGTALGYWGVPTGPYLVLPILGPSNVRDGFTRVAEFFLNPVGYTNVFINPDSAALATEWGLRSTYIVNTRAKLDSTIKAGKAASTDFYIFMREGYTQRRQSLINDPQATEVIDEFGDEFAVD